MGGYFFFKIKTKFILELHYLGYCLKDFQFFFFLPNKFISTKTYNKKKNMTKEAFEIIKKNHHHEYLFFFCLF